jgi:hypothetical protein
MINNEDSFPEVEFFPPEEFRQIGDRSGEPIWYVGKERGFGLPVVALHSDPVANDTEAIYLYEHFSLLAQPTGAREAALGIREGVESRRQFTADSSV